MAEIAKPVELLGRPGPEEKYPWSEWMDGQAWKIKQGEDFDTPTQSFVAALHTKAKAKGMKCKTRTLGTIIVFQFYTPEA
jgi:hypothetical protein